MRLAKQKCKQSGWSISGNEQVDIYQFLGRAFGQRVPVAQVIDLDVFDVVSVLRVDLIRHGRGMVAPSRRGGRGLHDQHSTRPTGRRTGGGGGMSTTRDEMLAFMRAAAAAAAALGSSLSAALPVGLRDEMGLRVRSLEWRAGGDLERRSKRDGRLGSVWSKRERFRGSSDMTSDGRDGAVAMEDDCESWRDCSGS